jgi:hypothetical protein
VVWLYFLPFLVLAQTATPSATIIPTLTSIPTPTVILNPSSNIFITEVSPTSDTEWTEIYNANNGQVQLVKWKLQTETTTRNIPDNTLINSKSYYVFNSTNFLSDSIPKTVKIVDQTGTQIDAAASYPANLDNGLSWSRQSDSFWCQTFPSSGQSNSGCYVPPSLAPTITNTPTPTPTNLPSPTSTPTPTNTPPPPTITLAPVNTPEIVLPTETPPTITGSVLSISISSESSEESKSGFSLANSLPIIFIAVGGILLAVPLIITELKKNQLG